jgi:predicted Zn-dependent protease
MQKQLYRWAALLVVLTGLACAPSREARLEEVRKQQAEGQFEQTLEPLRGLLDETPDDPELNHRYGLALLMTQQPQLAIWPLQKAAKQPDRAIEDGLLLAQALLHGGGADDAVVAANHVVELAPDRVDALRLLVQARIQAKQNEKGLADVERLLALVPGDPDALTARLALLLNLARVDEAEKAFADLTAAVKANGTEAGLLPRICAATATFLNEKEDTDGADAKWKECLDQYPADEVVVLSAIDFYADRRQPRRSIEALRRAHDEEPTNMAFISALAVRLGAYGKGDEAEEILRAATHDGVNDKQAWFALSDYYLARDEVVKARDALAQGLRLRTEAPPKLIASYVDLLIRAGDLDKAEEMLSHFPDEPVMKKLLEGRLLLARGKPAEAADSLEEGLRLWPDNSVGRLLLAEAAEQMGDYDRALKEYVESARNDAKDRDPVLELLNLLEALGRGDEASSILFRFEREKPHDAEVLARAIHIAGRAGQRELLEESVRLLDEIPGQRGVIAAELAGIQADRLGPAEGVESIRRADLDLTRLANAPALRALVQYLIADGKASEAVAATDGALAANPDAAVFHELRGQALRASAQPGPARRAVERALELEPERASALAELAALTAEQGDRPAAIALYDRAYAADPKQADYAWAAIQLIAASDDAAQLEPRLEALVAKHATHATALNLLASRLIERDPERAVKLAQRAVRLRGGPDALATLGRIQLARGENDLAVQALGRSVELRPDSASTQYWLGRALAAAGDAGKARQAFALALETQSFPEREAAKLELARLEAP